MHIIRGRRRVRADQKLDYASSAASTTVTNTFFRQQLNVYLEEAPAFAYRIELPFAFHSNSEGITEVENIKRPALSLIDPQSARSVVPRSSPPDYALRVPTRLEHSAVSPLLRVYVTKTIRLLSLELRQHLS